MGFHSTGYSLPAQKENDSADIFMGTHGMVLNNDVQEASRAQQIEFFRAPA